MAAYKILIDAMGGDYAPQGPVDGALIALERHQDLSIVLAGREND
ncbi:MAG: phosphate acyltransferase, partial [Firmicutes bacterium]|nr:phosphate acyltransferase [Bacillota bacterium]